MKMRVRTINRQTALWIGAMFLAPCAIAGGYVVGAQDAPRPVTSRSLPKLTPAPARAVAALKAAPAVAPAPDPAAYVVKSILPIDHAMKQGEYYWDESAAPKTGQIVVTVDLAAQVLSVFRDGHEIGTAVIIFGGEDKPTPLGVFNITQKDADHVSNLYDAPMPYMLRLTNDGISIHGSEVGDGYVTHGCVGTPHKFARLLFDAVKLGDRVIVSRGETLGLGQPIPAA
ncbi:MAG: L,D-transpeptidase family protein [Pseudomonadota bacterium]